MSLPDARPLRFSQLLALAAASGAEALGQAATSPLLGGSPMDPWITAVAHDHRQVRPGTLFVARKGERFDAHDRFADAVAAGAVALVGELPPSALPLAIGVPYARVADGRRALPQLAAALYGFPSRDLRVIGVTGTDGKTTTSFLTHHLLAADGPVGLITTVALSTGVTDVELPGHFTTPEADDVQRLLAGAVLAGAKSAVLESSSHGLALARLDAVEYQTAVWTNLSPEHLDHHVTFAAYREAKLQLVRRASASVLNADDPAYSAFRDAAKGPVTSYGHAEQAEFRIGTVRSGPGTLAFDLDAAGTRLSVRLPMVGRYNAHNAAAAVAAAALEGLAVDRAAERLASFGGVPGRMQVVADEPFTLIVDFAHTGPALEKALAAVKPLPPGRLIVVVGAAGERDPGKRGPLARAAVEGAEFTVFTEEDSRSEPTEAILAELAAAATAVGARAGSSYRLVPDRREAIAAAIGAAGPGDVVLLAGKGHERTLERADETLAWNEVAEAAAALSSAR